MKILTIFDGTLHSKTALKYGLTKIKENRGELVVLQVFQSDLFVDYDAGPGALEMARAEAAQHALAAQKIVSESGIETQVRFVSEDGDPEQELLKQASAMRPDLLLAPPRYKAIVKTAPCPVYLMPGVILVPVDGSDALLANLEEVVREEAATGSRILLLGVIPVHLYGAEEKSELLLVEKNTAASLRKIKKALGERGVEASEAIRSGFPDEEILKAADEFGASLIMLPAGGKTPSELTKAAAILLDEPERVGKPVYLMHPAEA